MEGSSIDWKDYKNVKGTAYTTINGEFAQFAVTTARPVEEDGTKKIRINIELTLMTKTAEITKQSEIYVEYV